MKRLSQFLAFYLLLMIVSYTFAAELPSQLSNVVPKYPSSTVHKAKEVVPGSVYIALLLTTDSIEKVLDYYKKTMTNKKWVITKTETNEKDGSVSLGKGKNGLTVDVLKNFEGSNKNSILLWLILKR
jgi:hypothetical protein